MQKACLQGGQDVAPEAVLKGDSTPQLIPESALQSFDLPHNICVLGTNAMFLRHVCIPLRIARNASSCCLAAVQEQAKVVEMCFAKRLQSLSLLIVELQCWQHVPGALQLSLCRIFGILAGITIRKGALSAKQDKNGSCFQFSCY